MRRLLPAFLLCGLISGVAAEQPGWFLEIPADAALRAENAALLQPVSNGHADEKESLNLRAGFRFSEAFSLSAALDEYLLDTSARHRCAATDFVCQAGRVRTIDQGSAYSLSLAPSIRLDDELSIYGHLGLQSWKIHHGGDGAINSREVLFGIGVGYDVSNPFRLQLEYRSMDLDIKLTSIGFTWRF